ncbi:hypothetical protein NXW84_17385 [Bacteroides fragilis]|nr:hypothetical protein NXW84_17385 [Bacteroides fragilis]
MRFHRDGDDPLSRIAFPAAGTGGKEQEEKGREQSVLSFLSRGYGLLLTDVFDSFS